MVLNNTNFKILENTWKKFQRGSKEMEVDRFSDIIFYRHVLSEILLLDSTFLDV